MPEQIDVASLVVGIDGDSSGLKKTFAQTMVGANTWSTALGNIIATGFTSLVSGAAQVVKKGFEVAVAGMSKATTMATGFQSQLAGLNIAASATGLSLDELHDLSLLVGGDTRLLGVSATGAADSMTNLFKAGLTASDVLGDFNGYLAEGGQLGGALRAAIDLAAASELDMVQASDLAAITMATFGIEADGITAAMNNFVQAADASVADVSDLRDAMVTLGPTAAAFGFSLEDTNNALALLSTRGIAGSEAGTALKSMLTNMMRQTDPVTDALRELNVSLYDSQGVMLPLPAIMGQFESALVGMTDEQKNNYIQTIAGTYGMKSMQTLLSEGTVGWNKMAAATMGASDTQTQAAAKAATMAGAMEALEGTVETFWIGLGEVGLPVLQRLANWAADMASKYGPLVVDAFQGLADAAMPFIDMILTALEEGNLFETVFAMLPEGMQGFVTWLTETVPVALAFLGEQFVMAQGWLTMFAAWFSEMLPLAIAFAVDAWTLYLLPALLSLAELWTSTLQPALMTIYSWFAELLPLAITVLADYWTLYLLPVLLSLQEAWVSTIQPALGELWSWLQERVPQAIAFLAEAWQTYGVPFMTAIGVFVTQYVIPAFAQISAWLITHIPVAIDTMVVYWNEIFLPALFAAWVWIQENLIPVFVSIGEWLAINIPIAIETAKMFWDTVLLPAIQAVAAWVTGTLIPTFQTIWAWLATNIPIAIAIAKNYWETILLPAIKLVWDFLTVSIVPIFEIVKTWLDATLPTALAELKSWWDTLKEALTLVWDFLSTSLFPLFKAIAEFSTSVFALALEALSALWSEKLAPAIEAVWKVIHDDLLPVFLAVWTFVVEKLQPVFKSFREKALDKIKTSLDNIKVGVQAWIDILGILIEKIKSVELPTWLKPGSPPPLYYALMDIRNAMGGLANTEIPALNQGLERIGQTDVAGRLSANVAPVMNDVATAAQVAGEAGAGGDTINNWNLPPHLAQVDSDRRLQDTVAYLSMASGGS